MSSRAKQTAVHLFVMIHLLLLIGTNWTPSFLSPIIRFARPYVEFLGLDQQWNLFAPNPLILNFRLDALIHFSDGTSAVYPFPQVEKMGLWERYQRHTFWKWQNSIRQNENRMLWQGAALYALREMEPATLRPGSIELRRYHRTIVPRSPLPVPADLPPNAGSETAYTFYTYTVP